MVRIGFILLTHAHPEQLLRLTGTLNHVYDHPPIVCHHDFAQCNLDRSQFAANVEFVEPALHTFWGCFAIVPAALKALDQLMTRPDAPDWFYLLSGSDYPVAQAAEVREFLSTTPYDAFIDHRLVTYNRVVNSPEADNVAGFSRPSYIDLAYRRYCAVAVPRPSAKKPFAIPPEGHAYLRHPVWRQIVPGPFSETFRCYAGEHWFSGNRRTAEVLLADDPARRRLLKHLSTRESPEECFYHSMLGNSELKLSADPHRYIDWQTPGAWHPKSLAVEDLPAIRRSGAHFARKIAPGSELLSSLDEILSVPPPLQLAAQELAGNHFPH